MAEAFAPDAPRTTPAPGGGAPGKPGAGAPGANISVVRNPAACTGCTDPNAHCVDGGCVCNDGFAAGLHGLCVPLCLVGRVEGHVLRWVKEAGQPAHVPSGATAVASCKDGYEGVQSVAECSCGYAWE